MKAHWDKLGQVSYMWVTRRSRNSEVHAAILYAFSWGSTTFRISVDIWNNYVCSCEAFLASGTHIVWMHPLPPRTLWPFSPLLSSPSLPLTQGPFGYKPQTIPMLPNMLSTHLLHSPYRVWHCTFVSLEVELAPVALALRWNGEPKLREPPLSP